MSLSSLGWSPEFELANLESLKVARITAVHRSHLTAKDGSKDLDLHLSGALDVSPAVGDWATLSPEFENEQGNPAAIIQEILPRKSFLSRWTEKGEQVIAANLDTVFVVTSANQDFNMNRLQRYLVLIQNGGATPVIILSKIDLIKEPQNLIAEIHNTLGVKTIGTSLVDDTGFEDVLNLLPQGSTAVFVGSSGVGKSSLVNRLTGEEKQQTKSIREDDSKGRHTTTSRQMFFIPNKGLIIDTPGIREVQVMGDEETLAEAFPRVVELIANCRFSDCNHETEPSCAVLEALEYEELDQKEWDNYRKLQRELSFNQRKQSKSEMSNAKKRWKDVNVMMRKKRKFEAGE